MDTNLFSSAFSTAYGNVWRRGLWGLVALSVLFCVSCATVGRDFPTARVSDIAIGKTTQNEIRTMFGSPWRVGIEDGQRTWTYGKYRYRLFGQTTTQDLVVRFDERDVVASYTFNTTEPEK
jgi:hypothetical protein